ncbi:MAG: 50S ribosomal protein L25 [Proteobacteria bacterium]|nr:50S ribosomal protein L25 [Pseudomonadota bacterium]
MKQQNLAVKTREAVGKGAARKLRSAGKVPAVFYGKKSGALSLEVDAKELNDILDKETGGSTFFNLSFEGGKSEQKLAILKELQADPVTNRLIHADFKEILMDEKMSAAVPVRLTGTAAGVEMGGTLQPIRRELEVSCLPKDLPEFIEIDVTKLEVGQSVHIDEVELPKGVEVPHDVNFTVAVVVGRRAEEEEAVEAEEETAEAVEGGEEAAAEA